MRKRTVDLVERQGKTTTPEVEWPEGEANEREEVEALGFTHMRTPVGKGPSSPQKDFMIFARYPDGMAQPHEPTVSAPWLEGYTYALLPYVGNKRQGNPVFLKNLSDVEGYMRSQLDPSWTSASAWPSIPLRYFPERNTLIIIQEPGKTRRFGIVQQVVFGLLDASDGHYVPMFMSVIPADVQAKRESDGLVHFAGKPISGGGAINIPAEHVMGSPTPADADLPGVQQQ